MLALFHINNLKNPGGALLSYMALTKNNRTERETPSADRIHCCQQSPLQYSALFAFRQSRVSLMMFQTNK